MLALDNAGWHGAANLKFPDGHSPYLSAALHPIVQFRGGKLAHEHIYWDQASVLVQIGLPDPDNLPVAGVAEARKMADKTLPSNALMPNGAKSDGKAI